MYTVLIYSIDWRTLYAIDVVFRVSPSRSYLLLKHLNYTHLSKRTNKIRSLEGAVIRHYLPDLGIQLIKLTSSAAPL